MAAKGKSSKNIDVICALRAFETTLRAACRSGGVTLPGPLHSELVHAQETSKPLKAVILSGSTQEGHVTALAACLASYAAAKSLILLGCNVGDTGLAAIASLLQASGSRWWHGCRLQALEISNASQQHACTGTTHQQHHHASARPATAPPAQVFGAQQLHTDVQLSRPCTGICPPLPDYFKQQAGSQHTQDDMRLSLRQIRYTVRAPKAMEVRAWALGTSQLGGSRTPPGTPGTPGSRTQLISSKSTSSSPSDRAACCFSAGPLQQLSLALGVADLQLQRLVLDYTALGDTGISILSTGLGNCSTLKVLSLRSCGIGPAGVQQLCHALVPACRQHVRSHSSAAAAAAGAMGSRMTTSNSNPQLTSAPEAAACQAGGATAASSRSSTTATAGRSTSREPMLLELHLSGNPLGAAGLHAVNRAVRLMPAIKVLGLADICLDCSTPAGQLEVQVLAHALLAGPNELSTLDFESNHIGDESALYLVGLLKGKASITLLKVTPRLSPAVIQQMSALLENHQRTAKTARVGKKKKAAV